tara:strand:- start:34616 stop:35884 length:1269 start_codon:yes stop_codon:yes gene_type:complete
MERKEAVLEIKIQGSLRDMAEDIRGCRQHPSFPSSKDEIFRKPDKTTLKYSIAKGHLAAMEFVTLYCRSYIPRLWTLMLACSSHISMLQESTRSVEHHDYYLPQELHKFPEIVKKIDKKFKTSFDLYKKAIDKGMQKQDAMYCLPLYTLTGDSFKLNLRELYHLKLVYPNIITEMYDWCIRKLSLTERITPGFDFDIKTWLEKRKAVNNITRYDPCPIIVSDEDPKNYEKYFNKIKSQNDTKLSNCSGPFKSKEIEFMAKRLHDPVYAGILKTKTSIRFDFACDLSVLHELLRHRTLDRNLLPITYSSNFNYCNHREWKDKNLHKEYNQNNKELESLYHFLVEGIPKSIAAGVLPHSLIAHGNINCNFKSMLDFLGQRLCKRAKPGIQKLANSLKDQIQKRYQLDDKLFYNCDRCVDSCDFK